MSGSEDTDPMNQGAHMDCHALDAVRQPIKKPAGGEAPCGHRFWREGGGDRAEDGAVPWDVRPSGARPMDLRRRSPKPLPERPCL